MRALAHPLRAALLDVLRLYGPLTATQAAARVDDTPSNCSFHLRTLAAAGLIEQAPSDNARDRPWRVVRRRLALEPGDTPQSRGAFDTAVSLMQDRALAGLREWDSGYAQRPPDWRAAAFSSLLTIRLEAQELAHLNSAIDALLAPYLADETRRSPDASGSRLPVRFLLTGYPVMPDPNDPASSLPESDDDDTANDTGDDEPGGDTEAPHVTA